MKSISDRAKLVDHSRALVGVRIAIDMFFCQGEFRARGDVSVELISPSLMTARGFTAARKSEEKNARTCLGRGYNGTRLELLL